MPRLRLPLTKWPVNSLKDVHSDSISPSQREEVAAAVEVAVVASEEAVEVIEEAVEVASVEEEVADSVAEEDSVVEEVEETEEEEEEVVSEDVNQSDSKAAEKCYEHDLVNQSSALEVNW